MNSYLNYVVEANLGFCFFLILYVLLLARENDFRFKRFTLLAGLMLSLVFPLIHFQTTTNIVPSVGMLIPTYWLPEFVVEGYPASTTENASSFFFYLSLIYGVGVVVFLGVFLIRLYAITKLIRSANTYRDGRFIIAESVSSLPTFSFFHFIFIAQREAISEDEKKQIIAHEKVHGDRFHSFDILLINILQVFFWFNPFLGVYKKIFIQLHEFEADARAVEDRNVNEYCSLLARVALLSADFKLANHFNNSLTLKRITMMKTIKKKIRPWKITAFAMLVPVIFFAIACQDQVADDLNKIAKNSSATTMVPAHIQQRYDQLTKEHPESTYILLQLNDEAMKTLKSLEERYGLPKSMEIYTGDSQPIMGASESGVAVYEMKKGDPQSFAIFQYNDDMKNLSEVTADGNVFTVVEKMPQFVGGMQKLGEYLGENIQYPEKAIADRVAGTVFVEFIVNQDGKISNAVVMRGLSPETDAEALRVIEAMPPWEPGMQDGKTVKVKYVVPIKFAI